MKLTDLNTQQLKAVKTVKYPVLVFAGAGSGKTRVLTYKIWHLIKDKIYNPNQILALTFTNKAAAEMKERIKDSINCDGVNVGTFHSIGARILRKHISYLNDKYNSDFTIYDVSDQKALLKEVVNQLNIAEFKELNINFLRSQLDKFKNSSMTVKEVESKANSFEDEKIAEVYKRYSELLLSNNAVDFNDLIGMPIKLFKKNAALLKQYQQSWKYILVDEFQDTNSPQFELISLLGSEHQNITVVGDDDQSIYGWRGANIDNILTNFKDTFPKAIEVKLEKNYRSTQRILDGAWSVVSNNTNRAEKKLVATKGLGEKISLISTGSDEDEANAICDSIKSEIKINKGAFKDFAVLYRTNAQSRMLEQTMMREGLPYNIVGGTKFYDRKEVKDVLAYLTLVCNPNDNIALKRIINFPVRGIGEKSITIFNDLALEKGISLFDSLKSCRDIKLRGKQQDSIENFYLSINKFHDLLETLDCKELLRVLLEEFNIENYYKNNPAEQDRYNNIQELKLSIDRFAEKSNGSLKEFLQEISLYTDLDDWDDKKNSVTLMTIHGSKGLEFSTVFVTGLEQGLFPLIRMDDDVDQLEEERRLFYVAVTRAMERVYLLNAKYRRKFGALNTSSFVQSEFLDEIDKDVIKVKPYKTVYTKRVVRSGNKKTIQISRTVTEFDDFKVGDEVQHNLFGVGVILVLNGTGENQKVGVEFAGGLRKKLIVKYARLKKID
jgi:DNA helicase-2/ATP-dependent DNA helicase PcrA